MADLSRQMAAATQSDSQRALIRESLDRGLAQPA
jgi:hypothetical protein